MVPGAATCTEASLITGEGDCSKRLLVRHQCSFGISTYELNDDGAFGH